MRDMETFEIGIEEYCIVIWSFTYECQGIEHGHLNKNIFLIDSHTSHCLREFQGGVALPEEVYQWDRL